MRFLIIGNGVAGTTAAFTIREREPEADLTLIGGESDYFFSRTALMYGFMDRLSIRDMEPYDRKLYDRKKIHRIRDEVVDLDADEKTIQLKSGKAVPYDRLLIATGSVPASAPWKGLDQVRSGLVNFVSAQDLEQCERDAASTRNAVVVGGGLIGIELVECLRHHGIHVTFLIRGPWYWPVALGGDEAEMITAHMRRHGVDVRLEESVGELRTDAGGRVSAVLTESGLELPCELLGIAIGVRPAIDGLRAVKTPPQLDRGVQVNPSFETSLNGVWAAGDCAEIQLPGRPPLVEQIWYAARRQGELAAHAMLGDAVQYAPPIFYNSAKFFDIEYTTVGSVMNAPPEASSYFHRTPGQDVSVRIVEQQGAVIGFNMLGSRWDHTVLERWIAERRPTTYVQERLAQAQFDVEFGRAQVGAASRTRW